MLYPLPAGLAIAGGLLPRRPPRPGRAGARLAPAHRRSRPRQHRRQHQPHHDQRRRGRALAARAAGARADVRGGLRPERGRDHLRALARGGPRRLRPVRGGRRICRWWDTTETGSPGSRAGSRKAPGSRSACSGASRDRLEAEVGLSLIQQSSTGAEDDFASSPRRGHLRPPLRRGDLPPADRWRPTANLEDGDRLPGDQRIGAGGADVPADGAQDQLRDPASTTCPSRASGSTDRLLTSGHPGHAVRPARPVGLRLPTPDARGETGWTALLRARFRSPREVRRTGCCSCPFATGWPPSP